MRGGFLGPMNIVFQDLGHALRQLRILRWFGICGEINVEF
jgi:hypothetical protein